MCVLTDKRGIAWQCPAHVVGIPRLQQGRQAKKVMVPGSGPAKGWELVIPSSKLKLMDQVREVLRVKRYASRTEQAYCDWIKR